MPCAERETVRVSRVRKKQVIWPVYQRVKGGVMYVAERGVDSTTTTRLLSRFLFFFQMVKMRVDCLEREISYYLGHYQLYERD